MEKWAALVGEKGKPSKRKKNILYNQSKQENSAVAQHQRGKPERLSSAPQVMKKSFFNFCK